MLNLCGHPVDSLWKVFGKLRSFYTLSTNAKFLVVNRTFFVPRIATALCYFKQLFAQDFCTLQHLYVRVNAHFPPYLIKLMK